MNRKNVTALSKWPEMPQSGALKRKDSKGPFKYYVIMFLTFLDPPTHLFDDVILECPLSKSAQKLYTVAINELLGMKNACVKIAMDFS